MNRANAPDALQIQALDNCGATSLCPEFLADMEPVFNKFVAKIQNEKREEDKFEQNRLDNIKAAKQLIFQKHKRKN